VSDPQRWRRVLSGKSRKQALAAVNDIAKALRRQSGSDPSLAGGDAGLAIFYGYLDKAMPGCGHQTTSARFLDRAIDRVARRRMSAGLYSGFPGIAWAVAHLAEFLHRGGEDVNQTVDEHLKIYLRHSPWGEDYDLIGGLTGLGIYALERLPTPRAFDCLKLIVERLAEMAECTSAGLTWFTPPELLSSYERKLSPNGYYNLGLAHGVPGPIVLLGQICRVQHDRDKSNRIKARHLLTRAVSWLLTQQPKNRQTPFRYWAEVGVPQPESRLAWCYGDLGIAAALFHAGRSTETQWWQREALRIAQRASKRPPERAGVIDCGVCHGAAGVAHIFNRLFQATGEAFLGRAARFWLEQTFQMRQRGIGIAGFPAWQGRGRRRWVARPGLLEGAAGIGLVLLAAATDIEPEWDRMLGLSGPRHA
jgi:lantibiotic modifying enzyme